MFRTRILCVLAALCCVSAAVLPAAAAEVDCDTAYCFCAEDFSADPDLKGICITALPDPEDGTVMLGARVLRPGDILTAQQVSRMVFLPLLTETDAVAQVCYLPIYENSVAASAAMTISIRGKEDKAPVAEDSALETYKNLAVNGMLKASDPEGQPLTYTITRQSRRGTVLIQEDGSFTYTPKKNKIGVDSFTFTATDPAGKVSREATVTIQILKPTDAKQYTDTAGHDCRFTAEWMRHSGIFDGETLAGKPCFGPEKEVTRGEFVTMLVKALDIPVEKEAIPTGYADEIPLWLQPYLAAAVRSGLVAGLPQQEVFGAQQPITGAEAAVILQNALDLTVLPKNEEQDAMENDTSTVPVWAESSLWAMEQQGISLQADGVLTRGDTAQLLYQAAVLQQTSEFAE